MYDRLFPLALLLVAGLVWRHAAPGGIPVAAVRQTVGVLVIYLLAPALILDVMLRAPPGSAMVRVMVAGGGAVLASLGLLVAAARVFEARGWLSRPQVGALLLAGAFGNGLGMALPAVDGLFHSTQNAVPLVYDLLVTIPLVWTVGVALAAHYGGAAASGIGRELLRLPPFLTVLAALAWQALALPVPEFVLRTCALVGQAAVPLLAFLVGLTLALPGRGVPVGAIGVALAVRLVASPLVAALAGAALDLRGDVLAATVVTAAAPSVIVGVALCDRYRLDAAFFGAVLTTSAVAYVLLAPVYVRLAG